MENSLAFEAFGMKAAATGSLAIIALVLAVPVCGAIYLIGKKRAWW